VRKLDVIVQCGRAESNGNPTDPSSDIAQRSLDHDASRWNRRSRDANSERGQLLWENQNPCYLCPVAGSNPRLGRYPAANRKESEFLFFYSQRVEKSRIGRIKPRISEQLCLDWLGSIRPPRRNCGLASAWLHQMQSRSNDAALPTQTFHWERSCGRRLFRPPRIWR
jgi:hypothetical protein